MGQNKKIVLLSFLGILITPYLALASDTKLIDTVSLTQYTGEYPYGIGYADTDILNSKFTNDDDIKINYIKLPLWRDSDNTGKVKLDIGTGTNTTFSSIAYTEINRSELPTTRENGYANLSIFSFADLYLTGGITYSFRITADGTTYWGSVNDGWTGHNSKLCSHYTTFGGYWFCNADNSSLSFEVWGSYGEPPTNDLTLNTLVYSGYKLNVFGWCNDYHQQNILDNNVYVTVSTTSTQMTRAFNCSYTETGQTGYTYDSATGTPSNDFSLWNDSYTAIAKQLLTNGDYFQSSTSSFTISATNNPILNPQQTAYVGFNCDIDTSWFGCIIDRLKYYFTSNPPVSWVVQINNALSEADNDHISDKNASASSTPAIVDDDFKIDLTILKSNNQKEYLHIFGSQDSVLEELPTKWPDFRGYCLWVIYGEYLLFCMYSFWRFVNIFRNKQND